MVTMGRLNSTQSRFRNIIWMGFQSNSIIFPLGSKKASILFLLIPETVQKRNGTIFLYRIFVP
jgi:hypothetical protein